MSTGVLAEPAAAAAAGEAKAQETLAQAKLGLENKIDEAKGATVHQFNPDASPAQKAQAAAKDAGSLAPVDMSGLREKQQQLAEAVAPTKAVASDVGTAPRKDLPLAKPAAPAAAAAAPAPVTSKTPPEMPGTLPPADAAPREIPAWFDIGWTSQTFIDGSEESAKKNLLADFLSDVYYGRWYHNAGIIVFAVLATYFTTAFFHRFGFALFILSVCATYYDLSIERTRRNARDDLSREVAKKGLKLEVESATWMNLFLERFWLIYEPVLSATIVASVDQVLATSTPAFLDSMRITTFTLGTKAPRIDHVKTFDDTADDVILMEWKVSFTPNDLKDMTHAKAAMKVNPKIVLNVRFGVGPATLGKDIIVEDMSFSGLMRIKLKLMTNAPHVQTAELSFMEQPFFDFVAKPVGFDLSMLPGLVPFIHSQVHASLGPMMYHPNTFVLDLEQMLSGAPANSAVGVLALKIRSARGLKGVKFGGGLPDPYVALSMPNRPDLARTSIKNSTSTPTWNETIFILVNNINEVLTLDIKDYNERLKDSDLGKVTFECLTLQEDAEQEGVNGEVTLDAKTRGLLTFDAAFFPVLLPKKLDDGTVEPIPETASGVVRLVIHQAKELDSRGSQINPSVSVRLNDKVLVGTSQTLKRTPNPVWEYATEFLVTDRTSAVVSLAVADNGTLASGGLGQLRVKLTDLLREGTDDWYPLTGARSGRVRLTASWKPVLVPGAISGAGQYTPPLGFLRVHVQRASDLKNVEGLTGSKSDPYARIVAAGRIVDRTAYIDNDLNPVWDEVIHAVVHSPKDEFVFEVMDYQNNGKDRTLGDTRLRVSSLLAEGTDKQHAPWLSTGKAVKTDPLRQPDGKNKGTVTYSVEFVPAVHLRDVSFREPEDAVITEEDENAPEEAAAEEKLSEEEQAAREKEELEKGVVIPREELLKRTTGIFAFQIISGSVPKRGARIEVLLNDGYWPAFTTEPARSPHATWDEIGEVFIPETDFSRITIQVNSAEKDNKADVLASASMDANTFIAMCLGKRTAFSLTDASGVKRASVVVMGQFVPVECELDPRESINNSGSLRIDIISAKGLPSADRSGKSDPYVVLEMNEERVFKSEVVKKTLDPQWNENFTTEVTSRCSTALVCKVMDWDRVGTATLLGEAPIDLEALEPMVPVSLELPLVNPPDILANKHNKHGGHKGTVQLRVLFRPQFISRSRGSTSGFGGVAGGVAGGVGTVAGGVAGVGVGVVGGVAGGVGGVVGGVGKAGKGVFGGAKRIVGGGRARDVSNASTTSRVPPVPSVPAGLETSSVPGSPLRNQAHTDGAVAGTLSVTIKTLEGAPEDDEKFAVVVRNATTGKSIGQTHANRGSPIVFDNTFTLKTTELPAIELVAIHKKTFGSDKPVGEATLNTWELVGPNSAPTQTLAVPLSSGAGSLSIMLSWAQLNEPVHLDDSRSVTGSLAPSSKTRSRFSRHISRSHREVSVEAE